MKTAFFRTLSPYKRRQSQQTAKSVYYAPDLSFVLHQTSLLFRNGIIMHSLMRKDILIVLLLSSLSRFDAVYFAGHPHNWLMSLWVPIFALLWFDLMQFTLLPTRNDIRMSLWVSFWFHAVLLCCPLTNWWMLFLWVSFFGNFMEEHFLI
jgi:hypothetical protein